MTCDDAAVETAELEARIKHAWTAADRDRPDPTITFFEALHAQAPGDPVRCFELANAYDWVAREGDAIGWYEAALAGGLDDDRDRRCRIQLGSSLRNVGRVDDAVVVLADAVARYPGSVAARCFHALALADAGGSRAAVADLLDVVVAHVSTDEMRSYSRPLRAYAADLR